MNTTAGGQVPSESPAARRSAPTTREAVFEAAYALTKAGSRPTIERIRLYLGNGTPRGSPNTVNAFLTQWWEQLTVRLAGEPVEAIHGLPPSVSGTLETLWHQALEAAQKKGSEELADREQKLAERAEALEKQTRELAAREQNLAVRASSLEAALALARDQLAAANHRAEALEAAEVRRAQEIHELQEHCRSSDAEIRKLRRQFDAERAELTRQAATERKELTARFDATKAQWLGEIEETRQIAKERALEIKRLRAELSVAVKQRDKLRAEVAKMSTTRTGGRAPRRVKATQTQKNRARRKQ